MANREGTDPMEGIHTVFVQTSLQTRLAILSHNHETISDFRDKFCKEHQKSFPEFGEISISALKVKRGGHFYRLPYCMIMSKAFEGAKTTNWFLNVDASRVENDVVADQKEIAADLELVDEHAKGLELEQGLETKVAEKTSRKRKPKSSDGRPSRKKHSISLDQSVVATTPSSRALCGKVQVEVAMTDSLAVSPRDKLDDILGGAIVKDTESRETDGVTMGDNQQASDADQELVDGHTKDEVKDVQANQTDLKETDESQKSCGQVPSLKLDDLTGAIEQDLANGETTTGLAKIDQEKELAPTSELVEEHITSRDDVTESHEACAQVQVAIAAEHCDTLPIDDLLSGAIEKDIARGEGSSLAPGAAADNLQTDELVTGQEDQLEAGNDFTTGPSTEKMSSEDDINQSTRADSTTSTKVVTEINRVAGNEKSVEDVGRANVIDNPANQQEANSGLTVTEKKKKKRKKSSKDGMDQSLATAIQNENEMGEKKRRKKKSSRKVVKEDAGNTNGDATAKSLAFTESGN